MITPVTYSFPTDVNGMHGIFIKIYGVDLSESYSLYNTQKYAGGINKALQTGSSGVEAIAADLKLNRVKDIAEMVTEQSPTVTQNVLTSTSTMYKETPKAYIFLPMPLDLTVNYNASWAGNKLTPSQVLIRGEVENRWSDSGQAIRYAMMAGVKSGVEGVVAAVGGGGGVSEIYGAISASKKVSNPYTELMYDSPSLRMFSFDWTLAPKNAKEAENIKNIVYSLKKAMHPIVAPASSAEGMVWEYPDYIDITFVKRIETSKNETQQQNEWLFTINKCAISNLNVKYDNKFHADGSPTAISFELQVMETQLLTQQNFPLGYDDGTGETNASNDLDKTLETNTNNIF